MIALLLLLACAPTAYERGYDVGCAFGEESGSRAAEEWSASCPQEDEVPRVQCWNNSEGDRRDGAEDGCLECFMEAFEREYDRSLCDGG